MITVYSEDHKLQHGRVELIDGELRPCVEKPERAEMILRRVREVSLGEVIAPEDFGLEPILRVHDSEFVTFLQTAYDEWSRDFGERDALPLNWAVRGFSPQVSETRIPQTVEGKLSYYSFDAATPLTAGTWQAATSSVNVALTAQKLVSSGEHTAFALCRPPGHHAAYDLYGGYCFLNNAAIAAQVFADEGKRVALLDVDYHHGNGTQSIFYARSEVFYISLHADPAYDYPYFSGYEGERGVGEGEGFNLNLPLPLGTNWQSYEKALQTSLTRIQGFAPDVLLVSLGVDTFVDDPISSFTLRSQDFVNLGERLASLQLPTLFVMEGGYAVERLGANVTNVLLGFKNE